MIKKRVSFWAKKPIKVPKKVSFKTKDGKKVNFTAKKWINKMKKEYVLKFCHPQITIQEESKEDFKKLMGLNEETFLKLVFVRLSKQVEKVDVTKMDFYKKGQELLKKRKLEEEEWKK